MNIQEHGNKKKYVEFSSERLELKESNVWKLTSNLYCVLNFKLLLLHHIFNVMILYNISSFPFQILKGKHVTV